MSQPVADERDLIVRNSATLRGGHVTNFQGTWMMINYRVGDTVLFSDGCIYLCIQNTVANEPPGNATYWIKLGSIGGVNFRQIVIDRLGTNTFATASQTNGAIDSPAQDSEISFDMNTGLFTFTLAQDRSSLVFRGIGGGGATWLNDPISGGGGSGLANFNPRTMTTDPIYDPFVGTSLSNGNEYEILVGLGGGAIAGPGNTPTNGDFSCVTNSQDNSDAFYAGGGIGGNPAEDGGGAGLAPISLQGGTSTADAGGGGAGGVGGGGGAATINGEGAGGGGGIGGSGGNGSGAPGGAGGSLGGNGSNGTIPGSSGGGGGFNDQPGLFSGDGGDGSGGNGGLREATPGQPGIYPLYTTLGVSSDRRKWPGTDGFAVTGRNDGVGGRIIIEYTW